MKQYIFILVLLATLLGCNKDEEEVMNYSLKGSLSITDNQYSSETQELRIGVFDIESGTLVKSEAVPTQTGESVEFSLTEIPENTYNVKIFVMERSVNIYSMINYGSINVNDDIVLSDKEVQLVTYTRIQSQVLNSCIMCHGGSSGELAANLSLMTDDSYQNLVNVVAYKSEKFRVKPFSTDSSFLLNVINKEDIDFDHPASQSATEGDIELIEFWISEGALNN